MILVLFAGLGMASLRIGGVVGSITVFLAIVLCMGLGIVAFVGRNEPQAFAIGFLVPVIAYAAIVLAAGTSELDPYSGRLPTTRALGPVYESVVTRTWFDLTTGQEVPNYDPEKNQQAGVAMAGFRGGRTVGGREQPDRRTFMLLAHVLVALAFGYVGGKFAIFVYLRQRQESVPASHD